jgi:hypothetical protein
MEEWQQGHDQFSKAKQKQLALNRDAAIKRRVKRKSFGHSTQKFRDHYDRIRWDI